MPRDLLTALNQRDHLRLRSFLRLALECRQSGSDLGLRRLGFLCQLLPNGSFLSLTGQPLLERLSLASLSFGSLPRQPRQHSQNLRASSEAPRFLS